MAGRGFGKTRTGAEFVRRVALPGTRGALVGPTAADTRDVMVEGPAGILAVSPPWNRPIYEPSKRRVTWPNGAQATLFSADEPDRLRGPQNHWGWCDELAAWRYAEAWDMLMFGMRLGAKPRVCITTTPRPIKLVRDLIKDPQCAITRGTTYDNLANLAPTFRQTIISKYEGTRLGRQELNAEVLEDVLGALWQRSQIDAARIRRMPQDLGRVVIGVDPATTSGENSDETGIIVAGTGRDGVGYVIEDLSGRYSPQEWAQITVDAYIRHKAALIVGETNQGGEMVEANLRTVASMINFQGVHAKRGKVLRAEPVSSLYEQGRVHHVGALSTLEDQMCDFTSDFDPDAAGYSPDRVDALVYALTELMVDKVDRPARVLKMNIMAR